MREYSVFRLVDRKDKKLMNYNCIQVLRSRGYKDDEIFAPIDNTKL
ncbi:hypothetical protein [Aquimarina sp. 2201CG14-23]|nr:hypothetical protein [Aquimarina sp. 2201CG14-23]MDH7444653.1 hypothetical protein [Aquimarina sp. 2201CG14-23]